MSRVDLAIVGGGPAGLAAAIHARLAGLTVRLFDRATPPIDKACGEGLMPDGVELLDSLGVKAADLGRPFAGIRYVAGDRSATGLFPHGAGLGIRRTTLQAALAERAEELGAVCHWGCAVEGVGRSSVMTPEGVFNAGWIVGADGLHSRVRQWLDLEVSRGRPRFGIRRHYRLAPWTDLVEVHWGDDCEAYVTPVADRLVGVAMLRGPGSERFDSLLGRFPELEERLAAAPVASKDRGAGPFWSLPSRVVSGNVALLGDAAGYLDAITGEGLSLAFHHARALVAAIASDNPAGYERDVRTTTRLPAALIRALLFIERRPRLRRRLVVTLADHPALFSRLLAIHARQLEPFRLGLVETGQLLRGLVGLG